MSRPKAAHAQAPWPFKRKPCEKCSKIHYKRETARACALLQLRGPKLVSEVNKILDEVRWRRALKAWDALLIDHGGEG